MRNNTQREKKDICFYKRNFKKFGKKIRKNNNNDDIKDGNIKNPVSMKTGIWFSYKIFIFAQRIIHVIMIYKKKILKGKRKKRKKGFFFMNNTI